MATRVSVGFGRLSDIELDDLKTQAVCIESPTQIPLADQKWFQNRER